MAMVITHNDKQTDVIRAGIEEREFQDRKHGPVFLENGHLGGGSHSLSGWVALIEAEMIEAKDALIKGGSGRDSLRSEITQVMALCMAALEQHGTDDNSNGRREVD